MRRKRNPIRTRRTQAEMAQRERHNAARRVKPKPKLCAICGETFTPKRSDAKTCSPRCRQALSRSKRKSGTSSKAATSAPVDPISDTTAMEAHIRALAEESDIAVIFRAGRKAMATRVSGDAELTPDTPRAKRKAPAESTRRAVFTDEIKSARSYLTGLHELGHHLGPDQNDKRIVTEIAAWEWALENARCRITPGIRKMISRNLSSYVERYEKGYGLGAKQAWLPSEDDRPDVYARLRRLIDGRYRVTDSGVAR